MHPECEAKGCTAPVSCDDHCVREAPDDDFARRLAEFTQRTWGGHNPDEETRADLAGLQSLAGSGAHPLRLAEQTMGGCLNALIALEGAVPAKDMPDEAITLINASATVLSLARSEIDTILKAEALTYAAGEAPDAA